MGGDDKKSGNARKEAISAETGRKNFDGKLPVISKTKEQSELISGNQCFRTCSLTEFGGGGGGCPSPAPTLFSCEFTRAVRRVCFNSETFNLDALCSNTFMKSLAVDQRQKIIDAMEKKEYKEFF